MDIQSIRCEIENLISRNKVFYQYRKSFHDAMQNDLKKLAIEFGFIGQKEYSVPGGFIDVAWKDNQGNIVLAIEIDSSVRRKSIEKLHALKKDVYRIWICYSPKDINIKEYEKYIGGMVMKYKYKFKRDRKQGAYL